MVLSLSRHNPLVVQLSQLPQHFCLRFFRFGRLFFELLFWLFFNLTVREQTLVSCFASRFCFMQIDSREDANTHKVISCIFQEVSARLSKNPARVTFASDNPFSRHASNSCQGWLRRCGGFRCRFLCTIVALMPETAIGLTSTTGIFLSTGNRYLLLLQRHSFPFDS